MAPKKPASLKVRALQWLAQREHSPAELRAKLLRLAQRGAVEASAAGSVVPEAPGAAESAFQNPERESSARRRAAIERSASEPVAFENTAESLATEVDAVVAWLTTHGYLSQQRFVESRVNARQSRFGNLRITRELQQHGVALDAEAQQALRASEYDRARDVWQRRYGAGGAPQDAAARVRQMRFLTGRGFSPEVIRRVLRAPANADD